MDRTTTWLILNMVRGIGPVHIKKLLEIYRDPIEILNSSEKIIPGILPPAVMDQLQNWKNLPWEKELETIQSSGIQLISIDNPLYPASLKQIPDPPVILYIKGNIPDIPIFIAIVGTRNPSSYGIQMAEKFSVMLAGCGICIISGMARGIDSIAHKAALKMKTPTVAILGCGLATIYPPENKNLAQAISETGALISEFPLNTLPEKFNFPRRNRIISGMSRAVVVIEAGLRSGALITAHLAVEQNKDVFVLPCDANRLTGKGNNLLIRKGACLVESPEEIIEYMNLVPLESHPKKQVESISEDLNLSDSDKLVYNAIKGRELSIEEIQTLTGKNLPELAKILTKLEIKGLITCGPGKSYKDKTNKI